MQVKGCPCDEMRERYTRLILTWDNNEHMKGLIRPDTKSHEKAIAKYGL